MHWIALFRQNYRRKDGRIGITTEEMAALVRTRNTGCSKALIEILESGGITHPEIADRIAHVTGATPEQRDSIVHKIHRGKRRVGKKKNQDPAAFSIKPMKLPENTQAVVQIGKDGREIARFASINQAARALKASTASISRRCNGEMWINSNEFKQFDSTFRFASEWDAMTDEQHMRHMMIAGMNNRKEHTC